MTRHPEEAIQTAIVDYLRYALPKAIVFHVPNGGRRGKFEAARFKKAGVLPGVSDLIICLPDGRVAFVEIKADKGRLTDAQTAFLAAMKSFGHLTALVRGVSNMQDQLSDWRVSARAVAV